MAGVNKQIIVGNLGKDAELKFFTDGTPVLNFSIASNKQWNDKEGNKQEKVTWFNCSLTGKLAEAIAQYMTKGKLVYVDGETDNYEYEKKDNPGVKLYGSRVKVDKLQLLGGGEQRQDGPPGERTYKSAAEAAAAAQGGAPQSSQPKKTAAEMMRDGELGDDDLPF